MKNKLNSTQFVGNKYRTSDLLKKQRSNESIFLLDTLQSKTKIKKMNNKYSQLFVKVIVPNV